MKKRIFRYLLIAILLFILLLLFLILVKERRSNQEQFFSVYCLSDEETERLEDGDIILRKGYGFVSKSIANFLNEKYVISHCGIIVKSSKGNYFVIHSVSGKLTDDDGVQVCTLKRFCRESIPNSIIVTRLKTEDHSLISRAAKQYLKEKLPFDSSFDLSDQSKIYCSELVWKILLDNYGINVYPVNKRPNNIVFSPFYNPEQFDVIINHHEIERQK